MRLDYLPTTSSVFKMSDLSVEERSAVIAWTKALFDHSSEGIEDSILRCALGISRMDIRELIFLRATKPKTLLKVAASLVMNTSNASAERKLETTQLNNGISYFTEPLLSWTLVGVIKALLREIFEKEYDPFLLANGAALTLSKL